MVKSINTQSWIRGVSPYDCSITYWGCLNHKQKGARARRQLVCDWGIIGLCPPGERAISLEYQIYSPANDTLVIGMVFNSRRGSANDYGVPWFGGDSGDKEYHPCMPIWQTEKASWFVCFITFANGHVCVIVCKFAKKYIRSNPHRSSGRLSKFVRPSEKLGRPSVMWECRRRAAPVLIKLEKWRWVKFRGVRFFVASSLANWLLGPLKGSEQPQMWLVWPKQHRLILRCLDLSRASSA